jgi:hypothetical protein
LNPVRKNSVLTFFALKSKHRKSGQRKYIKCGRVLFTASAEPWVEANQPTQMEVAIKLGAIISVSLFFNVATGVGFLGALSGMHSIRCLKVDAVYADGRIMVIRGRKTEDGVYELYLHAIEQPGKSKKKQPVPEQHMDLQDIESAPPVSPLGSPIRSPVGNSVQIEYDIFLSHDWGIKLPDGKHKNHERVRSIKNVLQEMNPQLRIFFDEGDLHGGDHLFDKLNTKILQSKCIMAFLTKNYEMKVNSNRPNEFCRHELEFAVAKRKEIIPVVLEPELKHGFSESEVGGTLWRNFHERLCVDLVIHDGDYYSTENCAVLLRAIEDKLSEHCEL